METKFFDSKGFNYLCFLEELQPSEELEDKYQLRMTQLTAKKEQVHVGNVLLLQGQELSNMKFLLCLRLDSYPQNIIHGIIIATLHTCTHTNHTTNICKNFIRKVHKWQDQIEIEHHSDTYLEHITCFIAERPLKAGLIHTSYMGMQVQYLKQQ